MSYDVVVWSPRSLPSDVTDADGGWRDASEAASTSGALRAFLDGLRPALAEDFEPWGVVDVRGDTAEISVPWSALAGRMPGVLQLAGNHGLRVFDFQLSQQIDVEQPGDAYWEQAAAEGVARAEGAVDAILEAAETGRHIPEPHGTTDPFVAPYGLTLRDPFTLPAQVPVERQRSRALAQLLSRLRSDDVIQRRTAALDAGGWKGQPRLISALRAALDSDADLYVRGWAAQSLGLLDDAPSLERMMDLAGDLIAGELDADRVDVLLSVLLGAVLPARQSPPARREEVKTRMVAAAGLRFEPLKSGATRLLLAEFPPGCGPLAETDG